MTDDFSLEGILSSIKHGISNASRSRNNLNYEPHDKQVVFHESAKRGRQYVGGNRSGKTTGGVNEDIWWLTGTHPFIETPEPPIKGRLVTVDFKNGWNKIIRPVVRQWLPPSQLINGSWEDSWNGREAVLTLANGSELEIMSYDQELDKFAGVPRHFTHFDEEPPEDIYTECMARLVDYKGSWWLTMTPVEGMTWTYDTIFEPSVEGKNPLIDIICVDMDENPYIDQEEINDFLSALPEEAKIIRGKGDYIPIGGLVLKFYNENKHMLAAESGLLVPPANWQHYISLDHGFTNPTAVLWHAVSPQGVVVTYDEHYKSEMTIEQHAEVIKEKEKYYLEKHGIVPFLRVADPAIKQRNAVTGLSTQIEYAQHGINFALGQTKDVKAGLDKMNNYHRLNKWFVTENCIHFRKEMKTYKRKTYMTSKLRARNNVPEEPQKKNDHACDSARYFFSFQPDLNPRKLVDKPSLTADAVRRMLSPGTTFNPRAPLNNLDPNFTRGSEPTVIYDEYVGEY